MKIIRPLTPLRQRMLEDMQIRNYSPYTIDGYLRYVAQFAKHFHTSPDRLDAEHIRTYQLHLLQQQVSKSIFIQTVCALLCVTLPIGLQNWNHRFAVNLSYKAYFILCVTELPFCHSALGLSTLTIGSIVLHGVRCGSIVLQNGIRCNVLETQGNTRFSWS
jgi:hypothetical protein